MGKKHITSGKWFAWYPVKTKYWGWVWLKYVWRTVDDRPEFYQGLLPEITYQLTRPRGEITDHISQQMTPDEKMELLCRSSVGLNYQPDGSTIAIMGSKSFQRLVDYEHYLIDKYDHHHHL